MMHVRVTARMIGDPGSCMATAAALMLRPLPMISAIVLILLAVGIDETISAGAQKAMGCVPWKYTRLASTARPKQRKGVRIIRETLTAAHTFSSRARPRGPASPFSARG